MQSYNEVTSKFSKWLSSGQKKELQKRANALSMQNSVARQNVVNEAYKGLKQKNEYLSAMGLASNLSSAPSSGADEVARRMPEMRQELRKLDAAEQGALTPVGARMAQDTINAQLAAQRSDNGMYRISDGAGGFVKNADGTDMWVSKKDKYGIEHGTTSKAQVNRYSHDRVKGYQLAGAANNGGRSVFEATNKYLNGGTPLAAQELNAALRNKPAVNAPSASPAVQQAKVQLELEKDAKNLANSTFSSALAAAVNPADRIAVVKEKGGLFAANTMRLITGNRGHYTDTGTRDIGTGTRQAIDAAVSMGVISVARGSAMKDALVNGTASTESVQNHLSELITASYANKVESVAKAVVDDVAANGGFTDGAAKEVWSAYSKALVSGKTEDYSAVNDAYIEYVKEQTDINRANFYKICSAYLNDGMPQADVISAYNAWTAGDKETALGILETYDNRKGGQAILDAVDNARMDWDNDGITMMDEDQAAAVKALVEQGKYEEAVELYNTSSTDFYVQTAQKYGTIMHEQLMGCYRVPSVGTDEFWQKNPLLFEMDKLYNVAMVAQTPEAWAMFQQAYENAWTAKDKLETMQMSWDIDRMRSYGLSEEDAQKVWDAWYYAKDTGDVKPYIDFITNAKFDGNIIGYDAAIQRNHQLSVIGLDWGTYHKYDAFTDEMLERVMEQLEGERSQNAANAVANAATENGNYWIDEHGQKIYDNPQYNFDARFNVNDGRSMYDEVSKVLRVRRIDAHTDKMNNLRAMDDNAFQDYQDQVYGQLDELLNTTIYNAQEGEAGYDSASMSSFELNLMRNRFTGEQLQQFDSLVDDTLVIGARKTEIGAAQRATDHAALIEGIKAQPDYFAAITLLQKAGPKRPEYEAPEIQYTGDPLLDAANQTSSLLDVQAFEKEHNQYSYVYDVYDAIGLSDDEFYAKYTMPNEIGGSGKTRFDTWRYMTEDEKNGFYYYLFKGDKEAAEYLGSIKTYCLERQMEAAEKLAKQSAIKYPVITHGITYATKFAGDATALMYIASSKVGLSDYDANAEWNTLSVWNSTVRETHYDAATEWLDRQGYSTMAKGANFVLSTFDSIVDSWVNAGWTKGFQAMTGEKIGEALGVAGFFGSAYTETRRDMEKKGIDSKRADAVATAAGIFEVFFEKIGLENIMNNADDWAASLGKQLGKSGFIEFSEEFNTELANVIFETAYMGNQSEWASRVEQMVASGKYKAPAAAALSTVESAKQVLVAGIGGLVSGEAGALVGRVIANRASAQAGAEIKAQDRTGAVISAGEALAETSDNETLRKLVSALKGAWDNNSYINDAKLGKLNYMISVADNNAVQKVIKGMRKNGELSNKEASIASDAFNAVYEASSRLEDSTLYGFTQQQIDGMLDGVSDEHKTALFTEIGKMTAARVEQFTKNAEQKLRTQAETRIDQKLTGEARETAIKNEMEAIRKEREWETKKRRAAGYQSVQVDENIINREPVIAMENYDGVKVMLHKYDSVEKMGHMNRMRVDFIRAMSKAANLDVVVHDTLPGNVNACIAEDGTMHISLSGEGVGSALSHELTHYIKKMVDTETWNDFVTWVKDTAAKRDAHGWETITAELAERYAKVMSEANMTEAQRVSYVEEEAICNLCEDVLKDEGLVRELVDKQPGIWAQIAAWFDKVLQNFKEIVGGRSYNARLMQSDLEELRTRWMAAFDKAQEAKEQRAKESAAQEAANGYAAYTGGAWMYSLSDEDYMRQAKEYTELAKQVEAYMGTIVQIQGDALYGGMFSNDGDKIVDLWDKIEELNDRMDVIKVSLELDMRETAKERGFNIESFHGTSAEFESFDPDYEQFGLFGKGIYTTEDQEVADSYQEKESGNELHTIHGYMNSHKELDMDAPAYDTAGYLMRMGADAVLKRLSDMHKDGKLDDFAANDFETNIAQMQKDSTVFTLFEERVREKARSVKYDATALKNGQIKYIDTYWGQISKYYKNRPSRTDAESATNIIYANDEVVNLIQSGSLDMGKTYEFDMLNRDAQLVTMKLTGAEIDSIVKYNDIMETSDAAAESMASRNPDLEYLLKPYGELLLGSPKNSDIFGFMANEILPHYDMDEYDYRNVSAKEIGSSHYMEPERVANNLSRDPGTFMKEMYKAAGYSGITHVGGSYAGMGDKQHQVHIAFDSNQFKSAEAITYDDDGNIIPKSERFSPENNRLKYSLGSEDVERYNEALGNGDEDTMREVLDKAAASAGAYMENGKVKRYLHGTPNFGYTKYSNLQNFPWAYATESIDVANTYAHKYDKSYKKPKIRELRTSTKVNENTTEKDLKAAFKKVFGDTLSSVTKKDRENMLNDLWGMIDENSQRLREHANNMLTDCLRYVENEEELQKFREILDGKLDIEQTVEVLKSMDYDSLAERILKIEKAAQFMDRWQAGEELFTSKNKWGSYNLSTEASEVANTLSDEGMPHDLMDMLSVFGRANDSQFKSKRWNGGYSFYKREDVERAINNAPSSGIMDMYVFPGAKPIVIDCKGKQWDRLTFEGDPGYTTDAIVEELFENRGYTAVYFKNIKDGGYDDNHGGNRVANEWVLKDPSSQLKSADLITVDDNGRTIPPDERMNLNMNELRFSLQAEQDLGNADQYNMAVEQYNGAMKTYTELLKKEEANRKEWADLCEQHRQYKPDSKSAKKKALLDRIVQLNYEYGEIGDSKYQVMNALAMAVKDAGAARGYGLNVFHGTSADFNSFNPDYEKYGLFGKGVYTTTSESVANSYQSKESGNAQRTLNMLAKVGKEVDMDAGASVLVGDTLRAMVDNVDDAITRAINDGKITEAERDYYRNHSVIEDVQRIIEPIEEFESELFVHDFDGSVFSHDSRKRFHNILHKSIEARFGHASNTTFKKGDYSYIIRELYSTISDFGYEEQQVFKDLDKLYMLSKFKDEISKNSYDNTMREYNGVITDDDVQFWGNLRDNAEEFSKAYSAAWDAAWAKYRELYGYGSVAAWERPLKDFMYKVGDTGGLNTNEDVYDAVRSLIFNGAQISNLANYYNSKPYMKKGELKELHNLSHDAGTALKAAWSRMGYSGITHKGGIRIGGKGEHQVHIFFNPSADLKLADAITYDKGKPVPISKRFDENKSGNKSLLYSLRDEDYIDAIRTGNKPLVHKIIMECAAAAGAWSRDGGLPSYLFHGTKAYGFHAWDKQKAKAASGYGHMFLAEEWAVAADYMNEGLDLEYKNPTVPNLPIPNTIKGVFAALDHEYGYSGAVRLDGETIYLKQDYFYQLPGNKTKPQGDLPLDLDQAKQLLASVYTQGVYKFFLFPKNAVGYGYREYDARGNNWDNVPYTEYDDDGEAYEEHGITDEIAMREFDRGFSALHFRNIIDGANMVADEWVIDSPNTQLKYAYDVIFDDDGNPVPPSVRFNLKVANWRASLKTERNEKMEAPQKGTKAFKNAIEKILKSDNNILAGKTEKGGYVGTKYILARFLGDPSVADGYESSIAPESLDNLFESNLKAGMEGRWKWKEVYEWRVPSASELDLYVKSAYSEKYTDEKGKSHRMFPKEECLFKLIYGKDESAWVRADYLSAALKVAGDYSSISVRNSISPIIVSSRDGLVEVIVMPVRAEENAAYSRYYEGKDKPVIDANEWLKNAFDGNPYNLALEDLPQDEVDTVSKILNTDNGRWKAHAYLGNVLSRINTEREIAALPKNPEYMEFYEGVKARLKKKNTRTNIDEFHDEINAIREKLINGEDIHPIDYTRFGEIEPMLDVSFYTQKERIKENSIARKERLAREAEEKAPAEETAPVVEKKKAEKSSVQEAVQEAEAPEPEAPVEAPAEAPAEEAPAETSKEAQKKANAKLRKEIAAEDAEERAAIQEAEGVTPEDIAAEKKAAADRKAAEKKVEKLRKEKGQLVTRDGILMTPEQAETYDREKAEAKKKLGEQRRKEAYERHLENENRRAFEKRMADEFGIILMSPEEAAAERDRINEENEAAIRLIEKEREAAQFAEELEERTAPTATADVYAIERTERIAEELEERVAIQEAEGVTPDYEALKKAKEEAAKAKAAIEADDKAWEERMAKTYGGLYKTKEEAFAAEREAEMADDANMRKFAEKVKYERTHARDNVRTVPHMTETIRGMDATPELNEAIKMTERKVHEVETANGKRDTFVPDAVRTIVKAAKNSNFLGLKDYSRVLDKVAGKNREVREAMHSIFERPFLEASYRYTHNLPAARALYLDQMKELGINLGDTEAYEKASAAMQKYAEGFYYVNGEKITYTLDDLKAEFPESWENIRKGAEITRDLYDDYLDRINNMLEDIYPNVIEHAYEDKQHLDALVDQEHAKAQAWRDRASIIASQLEKAQEQLSRMNPATAAYTKKQNSITAIEGRLKNARATAAYYEGKEAVRDAQRQQITQALATGDDIRNRRLLARADYMHHTLKEKNEKFTTRVKNAWTGDTGEIPPELVGKTDTTKPKTMHSGFMEKRTGTDYKLDAIGSMLSYMEQAERKLAYDPFIAHLTNMEKLFREAATEGYEVNGVETVKANDFIRWIAEWRNDIAGKSNKIDRAFSDSNVLPRSLYETLRVLGGRANANAVLLNLGSAAVQASNIVNAKTYVTNYLDWARGAALYAKAAFGSGDEASNIREIYQQSTFMTQRYGMELEGDPRNKDSAVKRAATAMMGFLDEVAGKWMWWSAYNQYNRGKAHDMGYSYNNAIEYADDVTRRSVAGRGIGERPFTLTSQFVNVAAPFQLEVVNTMQNLGEQIGKKNVKGLMEFAVSTFVMNLMFKAIFGQAKLPWDIIDMMYTAISKAWDDDDDEEKTDAQKFLDTGKYLAQGSVGMTLSSIPFNSIVTGQLSSRITSALGDFTPENYSGSSLGYGTLLDTAYSAGHIGLNALTGKYTSWDVFWTDFVENSDWMKMVLPYGGVQAQRTLKGLDAALRGYSQKLNSNMEPEAQFAINGFWDSLKAATLGKWATSGGKAYLAGETRKLSAEDTAAMKASGMDASDFFTALGALRDAKKTERNQYGEVIKTQSANQYEAIRDADPKLQQAMLNKMGEKAAGKAAKAVDAGIPLNTWLDYMVDYGTYDPESDEGKNALLRQRLVDDDTLTNEQKQWMDTEITGAKTENRDYRSSAWFELSGNEKNYRMATWAETQGVKPETALEWFNNAKAIKYVDEYGNPHKVGDNDVLQQMQESVENGTLSLENAQVLETMLFPDKNVRRDFSSKDAFEISSSASQYAYWKASGLDASLANQWFKFKAEKLPNELGVEKTRPKAEIESALVDAKLTPSERTALHKMMYPDDANVPDYRNRTWYDIQESGSSNYKKALIAASYGIPEKAVLEEIKAYTEGSAARKAAGKTWKSADTKQVCYNISSITREQANLLWKIMTAQKGYTTEKK